MPKAKSICLVIALVTIALPTNLFAQLLESASTCSIKTGTNPFTERDVFRLTGNYLEQRAEIIKNYNCLVSKGECRTQVNIEYARQIADEIEKQTGKIMPATERVAFVKDFVAQGARQNIPLASASEEEAAAAIEKATTDVTESLLEGWEGYVTSRETLTTLKAVIAAKIATMGVEKIIQILNNVGTRVRFLTGIVQSTAYRIITNPEFASNTLQSRPVLKTLAVGTSLVIGGTTITAVGAGIFVAMSIGVIEGKIPQLQRTVECRPNTKIDNTTGPVRTSQSQPAPSVHAFYGQKMRGDKEKGDCVLTPIITDRLLQFFHLDDQNQAAMLSRYPDLCKNISQIHIHLQNEITNIENEITVRSCKPTKIEVSLSGELEKTFGKNLIFEGEYKRTTSPGSNSSKEKNTFFRPQTRRAVFTEQASASDGYHINSISYDESADGKSRLCIFEGPYACGKAKVRSRDPVRRRNRESRVERQDGIARGSVRYNPSNSIQTDEYCQDEFKPCSKTLAQELFHTNVNEVLNDTSKTPADKYVFAANVYSKDSLLTPVRNKIAVCCNELMEKSSNSLHVQTNCQQFGGLFAIDFTSKKRRPLVPSHESNDSIR